jgi:phosphate transport system ATP-binding protein
VTQSASDSAILALPDSVPPPQRSPKLRTSKLSAYFGTEAVVRQVTVPIADRCVTSIIGPSASGKSTFLRCLNRMHETTPGARVEGEVYIDTLNIYDAAQDPTRIRRRMGTLIQRPSPFPTLSIRDNVLAGLRLNGADAEVNDALVEKVLRQVALWDDTKNRLDAAPSVLNRGEQQRLCLARALALAPDVLLMDEPCVLLDPVATTVLEELIHELKEHYTIVIATHSVQQAARVSDYTAFLYEGELVEYNEADVVFTRPRDRRTEDYITGRFG